MSFEEEFDKIIRQKSEEVEYPFDEKNWESAKAMIGSERKATRIINAKKVLKPALALTALAAAVLITMTYVEPDMPQSNLIVEQKTKNSSVPNSAAIPSISKGTEIKITAPVISNAAVQNEKQTPTIAVNPVTREKTNISSVSKNPTSIIPAQTSEDSEQTTSGQFNEVSTANNSGVKVTVVFPTTAYQTVEHNGSAILSNDETVKPEFAISEERAIKTAEAVASESQMTVDQLSGLTLSLPYEASGRSLEVANILTIIKYDDAYFKQKRKTHYLNVEAGMAYLTGWNTASGNDGKGFDYFGGINYGIYLSNKLSIGMGVQAYNVANMTNSYYSSSHKEYDFGSTTIYTVVTCTKLYYAAIPLKINYAINKSNKIGLGFNAAYAFNSKVNTESYYYSDAQKVQNTSSSGEGIYDGMNQYNYMLTAHYSWRFAKRFGLNVEAMYGLTDLFKNNTETSNSEKSSGIRFSLSYTIFDK
jgi:hypothetical protein